MNRRERRALRPGEWARQDQAEAFTRDAASRPGTLVLLTGYADADRQCCWCDCPGPHPEADCAGCPSGALYVIQVRLGPEQTNYPVCEDHYRECCQYQMVMAKVLGAPAPEFRVMPIRDDDLAERAGGHATSTG